MTAPRLDGSSGYAGLKVSRKIVRPLTSDERDSLAAMLASTSVLAMGPANYQMGLDGSRWIIEGSAPGEYRYVNRWSPDPEYFPEAMPVREAGLFLLGLTGWSLEPIY